MSGEWPDAFEILCHDLRVDRGCPAMVDMSLPASRALIDTLSLSVAKAISLGERVAHADQAPMVSELVAGISGASVLLVDIDVLFTPEMGVDVLSQLRRTAMNTALIVAWPGRILGGRLSYSLPGRVDHLDELARDLVVLRPVEVDFPDEVPYTVERYPA